MPVKVVSSFYPLPETLRRSRGATTAPWTPVALSAAANAAGSASAAATGSRAQPWMAVFHLPVRKRSHIQMQRAVLSKHMQTMVAGRLKWKT